MNHIGQIKLKYDASRVKCFIEQLKLCLKFFSPMSLVCIKLRHHYPQQASTMYYKISVFHFYKSMSYCTDFITLHNSHESNQGTEYWPKTLLDVSLEFETTSHIHWLSMRKLKIIWIFRFDSCKTCYSRLWSMVMKSHFSSWPTKPEWSLLQPDSIHNNVFSLSMKLALCPPWLPAPLTSSTGLALLYTDRMWVMLFWDKLSLFSESGKRRREGENVDQWFFSVNFYETLSRQSNAIRRERKCIIWSV